ncbi:hypothetical protein QR680_011572 [Steinernema hermaphroditum]|uniref:Arrestin C-terminal-like domain-containing protein n=1 Tax=Steinernema hermaphroditum TaxID=289476 RepID=A0AA39HZ07_9BILA|nr:hypothetical protein QR680_011572 [Steinernema hermaphroditum]
MLSDRSGRKDSLVLGDGIKVFDILILNEKDYYEPGDIIEGNVVLQLTKKIAWREFCITLSAEASTAWSFRKSRRREMQFYQGNHEFFTSRVLICKRAVLRPGNYKRRFKFELPRDCVSSYSGEYGHIFYTLRAIIERPIDNEVSLPVKVRGAVDLRATDPMLRHPIENENTEEVGNCCWKDGWMTVKVKLRQGGFAIGETIEAQLEVENYTSKPIVSIEASILEHSSFIGHRAYARMPVWAERDAVKMVLRNEMEVNIEKGSEELVIFPVPLSSIPSPQIACSIIQTRHTITFCARTESGQELHRREGPTPPTANRAMEESLLRLIRLVYSISLGRDFKMLTVEDVEKMTPVQLKAELKARKLPVTASKDKNKQTLTEAVKEDHLLGTGGIDAMVNVDELNEAELLLGTSKDGDDLGIDELDEEALLGGPVAAEPPKPKPAPKAGTTKKVAVKKPTPESTKKRTPEPTKKRTPEPAAKKAATAETKKVGTKVVKKVAAEAKKPVAEQKKVEPKKPVEAPAAEPAEEKPKADEQVKTTEPAAPEKKEGTPETSEAQETATPVRTDGVCLTKNTAKMTPEEARRLRAQRFGIPLVNPEDKRAIRAQRFGAAKAGNGNGDAAPAPVQSDESKEKMLKRAERFGIPVGETGKRVSETQQKKQDRAARFGAGDAGDDDEVEAKKRKRAERFGLQ